MGKFRDLTGQRFGLLSVEREVEPGKYASGQLMHRWLCRCDCGNTIITASRNLLSGGSTSCGCSRKANIKGPITHNKSRTRLYHIWCDMRSRCNQKNNKQYHLYGGRGIRVCGQLPIT